MSTTKSHYIFRPTRTSAVSPLPHICAMAAVPAKGWKPGTPAYFDTAMIIDRQGDGTSSKFGILLIIKTLS